MLPQAAEQLPSMGRVAGAMLAGILVMFFLLRMFHVHAHGDLDHDACEHSHDHEHDHDHDHGHDQAHEPVAAGHRLNWVGLYFGLAIHTLLDGMALAASAVADAHQHPNEIAWYGLGTFLAVVLHKPLDALAITSLMHTGGWSRGARRP